MGDQQTSEVFAGAGAVGPRGARSRCRWRYGWVPPTLRLFSTVATFGTPRDVAASELAIETFLPADDASRRWLVEANV